jgi:F-type H+-transporting ATPase subunit b
MLIDWFTVFAQMVNFLILVVLLKHFLYKPVLDALDAREKNIASKIAEAQKKDDEAQKSKEAFDHKNEDFEKQRVAQLAEATESVKKQREQLMTVARKDSEDLRDKLNKAVADERESLKKKIETFVQAQVISVTRKALHDLADASLERLIANALVHQLQDLKDPSRMELAAGFHGSAPVIVESSLEMAEDQRQVITKEVQAICGNGFSPKMEFRTKPELISGIELLANGQKIGWNISGYLNALNEAIDHLLQEKTANAK